MKHKYLNSDRYSFAGLFQTIWMFSVEHSLRTHVLVDFKSKQRSPLQLQDVLPWQADGETASGRRVTSATRVTKQCYSSWLASKAVEALMGYVSLNIYVASFSAPIPSAKLQNKSWKHDLLPETPWLACQKSCSPFLNSMRSVR